ncbi:MAG: helix-turn-helix domain-containing protein [Phycisphaerales bacterium]|nr:helix-turn-helix domain-containing protein [Phycisphaerales bacterium]
MAKHRNNGAPADGPDFPFVLKLPDGRTVAVELPGAWVQRDRDGSPALTPEAVAYLDRVQVAFQSVHARPMTPAYLLTLRRTFGLTQKEFGEFVGVDKLTVSRWERGQVKPGRAALVALEKARKTALRRGVAVGA